MKKKPTKQTRNIKMGDYNISIIKTIDKVTDAPVFTLDIKSTSNERGFFYTEEYYTFRKYYYKPYKNIKDCLEDSINNLLLLNFFLDCLDDLEIKLDAMGFNLRIKTDFSNIDSHFSFVIYSNDINKRFKTEKVKEYIRLFLQKEREKILVMLI